MTDVITNVITKELIQRIRENQKNQPPSGEPTFIYHTEEPQAKKLAKMLGVGWQPDEKGNQRIGMYLIMTESIYLPVEEDDEPQA
jgi:hypothetical protein